MRGELHVPAIFVGIFPSTGGLAGMSARTVCRVRRKMKLSHHIVAKSYQAFKSIGIVIVLSSAVVGCTTDDNSLRNARAANLASETALNAQIISDRAREQRCDRDPGRRECGPR